MNAKKQPTCKGREVSPVGKGQALRLSGAQNVRDTQRVMEAGLEGWGAGGPETRAGTHACQGPTGFGELSGDPSEVRCNNGKSIVTSQPRARALKAGGGGRDYGAPASNTG